MRTIIILISSLVGVSAAACGAPSADDDRMSVVASFYPLAYAAEQVGGSSVDVRNLTPPGAEPHDLEATPGDVQQLHEANVVLLLGQGFQPQLEDVAGDGERVIRALDTPELRLLDTNDAHVWLDPLRYALIVDRVGTALSRPAGAERLVRRLRSLDRQYRQGLADCARREFVTSHDAFSYLASRYGLRQIPITGQSPEGEPAPQDLERAVDAVRESGATTVFVEPLVSPRIAATVARAAGARTAELHPLEGLTEEQQERGDDYFSLMRANLDALREALGCR